MPIMNLTEASREAVTEALHQYRREQEGTFHGVPSPSGVAHCRFQQWCNGTGVPRTNPVPPQSIKKMESGTAIEPFWRDIYSRAGLQWSELPKLEDVGPFKQGQGDGKLTVTMPGLPWPVGTSLLLELKDLGVWTYFNAVEKGLRDGLPDYYAQVQVYLGLYGMNQAIFHAGQADASAVTYVWRRIKRRSGMAPPFYLEVVEFNPEVFGDMMDRADDVKYHVSQHTEPPLHLRDYDVKKLGPAGTFPCGYCGWLDYCLEVSE